LRSPPDFAGHYDPHVWMDVAAWSQCVDHVAQSLAKFDPPHAEEYSANAKAYREELTKLDDYVRKSIKSIPEKQRVLVTAHDAFEYFSRAYKIDVKSVQGVTTESEAGVLDVNRLVDFLVERKLPAIFIESSVNAKNIEAVMEGTKSRDVVVRIGGELYSDAMGAEGTYEGTYIGMIDHNATVIAASLGGSVPEKGMTGKLATAIKGGEAK
jgi:manganese/zinc/iron transport system substrate-binding protein